MNSGGLRGFPGPWALTVDQSRSVHDQSHTRYPCQWHPSWLEDHALDGTGGGGMVNDRRDASHRLTRRWFTSWSGRYERSILQRLLFGPSHRIIIRRLGDRFGDHPLTIL